MWRDRIRTYGVLIDGVERGRVRNGETVSIDVEPGLHRVRIKIDWTGSNELSGPVAAGERLRFECGPTGSWLTAFPRSLESTGWVDLRFVGSEPATPPRP